MTVYTPTCEGDQVLPFIPWQKWSPQLLVASYNMPVWLLTALQFSKAVSQLDVVQQHLSLALKSNEKNLAEVQKSFAENTETIMKNLALLEAKMAALKK